MGIMGYRYLAIAGVVAGANWLMSLMFYDETTDLTLWFRTYPNTYSTVLLGVVVDLSNHFVLSFFNLLVMTTIGMGSHFIAVLLIGEKMNWNENVMLFNNMWRRRRQIKDKEL